MAKRQETLARELVHEGKSISDVARIFNVHPATVYRYLEHQRRFMTVHRSSQPHDPTRTHSFTVTLPDRQLHMDKNSALFYTIGHSTRSVTELVRLLREAGADFIVDVRSIPRSRTNPQFNGDTLPDILASDHIGYRHIKKLGGLRGRRKDQTLSKNSFWENDSFQNYADYAATPAFRDGMAELYDIGRVRVCAIMCAETLWWRCHRRIITDYLLAGGQTVSHIMGPDKIDRASINPAAVQQRDGTLLYVSVSP